LSTDLAGKVALVTGGSRGIGAAICRRLAQEGSTIAVAHRSAAAEAEAVASEISSAGGVAQRFVADLAEVGEPERLIAEVQERFERIDVLVANHGVGTISPLGQTDVEVFDRATAVNLRSPFFLVQAALAGMRDRGFGRILFMSSAAAFRGGPIGAHYAASKSGLHGMTHYLSAQLAAEGITVNAIAPGFIDTEMLPGDPDELAKLVPVGRIGRPRRSPTWRSRRWATRSSPTTWCSWTEAATPASDGPR
jgi:3-oxoacyl-[acyl-carrier protein] reductase